MDMIPVESVGLADGLLSWKPVTGGSIGTAKEQEIVFVLGSADLEKTQFGFIICCLAEDASDPDHPYRPSFLAADTLPDNLLQEHLVRSLPSHLSAGPGSNNRIDVIVSAKSGTNLALAFWQTVVQPLLSLSREVLRDPTPICSDADKTADALIDGAEPHVVVTQSAHSVRQYAQALPAPGSTSGSRTIVLLSGDGGVVDLLNGRGGDGDGMASRTGGPPPTLPIIALMPLGTGNALFHSLHKPIISTAAGASPLVLALRTLFRGSPAKLPTFRASFSPAARVTSPSGDPDEAGTGSSPEQQQQQRGEDTPVNRLQGAIVASYGFHASVVYESDTPEYRKHGAKRFGMVAQDLLRESHPYRAHVDVRRSNSSSSSSSSSSPGKSKDGRNAQLERIPRESHAYVLAALVSNLEQNFCISPDSQALDGQLRLVHFAAIGGERTMAAMMAAYDGGKHIGMAWDEDGEKIGYEQVDEIRVTMLEEDGRWRKVCVDGTILEVPRGGYMSVTRGDEGSSAFQVLVDPRVIRA